MTPSSAQPNRSMALKTSEVRFVQEEPPGVPTSWWRGVGPTRSGFIVESFIDELAAAARKDPAQYRRALLRSPRMRAALDVAVREAGWGTPLPPGRGRGIAIQFAFGSYLAQVVEVSIDANLHVKVDRVVCALDCRFQFLECGGEADSGKLCLASEVFGDVLIARPHCDLAGQEGEAAWFRDTDVRLPERCHISHRWRVAAALRRLCRRGNACDHLDLEVEARKPVDSNSGRVRIWGFREFLAFHRPVHAKLLFRIRMKRRQVDYVG